MAYILDILKGTIQPLPGHISLERYVVESSYITKYLSRVVKDKALVVYSVLFQLSWFETGKGEIVVPWARVGAFIRSEQGNIIDDSTTVKRRLSNLFEYKCIAVNRKRSGANEISVHLPTDIPACQTLIEQEEKEILTGAEVKDERDYYNDPGRRLVILARNGHACVYCTAAVSEDTFVLDHLLPVARGGTNRKQNLVAACEVCNRRRSELEPVQFLRENYRQQLLTQEEFLRQKSYIEALLAECAG
jgi:hypothetical protein